MYPTGRWLRVVGNSCCCCCSCCTPRTLTLMLSPGCVRLHMSSACAVGPTSTIGGSPSCSSRPHISGISGPLRSRQRLGLRWVKNCFGIRICVGRRFCAAAGSISCTVTAVSVFDTTTPEDAPHSRHEPSPLITTGHRTAVTPTRIHYKNPFLLSAWVRNRSHAGCESHLAAETKWNVFNVYCCIVIRTLKALQNR